MYYRKVTRFHVCRGVGRANRYLRLYSKRLGPVQVKPTRPPCGCLGNVVYLYGVLDAGYTEYIFVNFINQNGNHIDEYGYNIRVELLDIVTWFQVDSDLRR